MKWVEKTIAVALLVVMVVVCIPAFAATKTNFFQMTSNVTAGWASGVTYFWEIKEAHQNEDVTIINNDDVDYVWANLKGLDLTECDYRVDGCNLIAPRGMLEVFDIASDGIELFEVKNYAEVSGVSVTIRY